MEPISKRPKTELRHPNKNGDLVNLSWSPDGSKILAGDYSDGALQVWDVATGNQLTKIEVGTGQVTFQYFYPTPDWKRAYASSAKRKWTPFEKDGKTWGRLEGNGKVRSWDLASGQVIETFQHSPPRHISVMKLSPSGHYFITRDELPGEYERYPKYVRSLWHAATKSCQTLPDAAKHEIVFSPDDKSMAVEFGDGEFATGFKLLELPSMREIWSISTPSELTTTDVRTFSPDGRYMLGSFHSWPSKGDAYRNWDTAVSRHILWDTASGREIWTFMSEKGHSTSRFTFSPDGRRLVAIGGKASQREMQFIDVATGRVTQTTLLEKCTTMWYPEFSPDGQWVAIASRMIPPDIRESAVPEDVPQPRLNLIEAATGIVRETLVLPPGFTLSARFSPDGKTLATVGRGRVYIWDMTTPPGELRESTNAQAR